MTQTLSILAAALAAGLLAASPAPAQTTFVVGPQELMGVAIGTEAEAALSRLTAALGPGVDSGWSAGCEVNGVDERSFDWGGLRALFEEVPGTGAAFVGWSYGLDRITGAALPGGPAPDQFALPGGVRLGDRFSDAARVYGFDPVIDEVFGVGLYFGRYFALMTSAEDIDAPITEVAVPYFAMCE